MRMRRRLGIRTRNVVVASACLPLCPVAMAMDIIQRLRHVLIGLKLNQVCLIDSGHAARFRNYVYSNCVMLGRVLLRNILILCYYPP